MPKRLPGDFPLRLLELPPVLLDAYLTARAAARGELSRAVTAARVPSANAAATVFAGRSPPGLGFLNVSLGRL